MYLCDFFWYGHVVNEENFLISESFAAIFLLHLCFIFFFVRFAINGTYLIQILMFEVNRYLGR